VSDGYPKPISNWEGIPNNVDDALQYSNGFTYFFKDGKYWRFNDKKFQVGFLIIFTIFLRAV
jgi:matrix metalloproteinase-14 (membrane-inserted)